MQYLRGTQIIVVPYSMLVPAMYTAENFRQRKSRSERKLELNPNAQGCWKVHGKNGKEGECLVEYGSMSREEKVKIIDVYGDPREYIALEPLRAMVTTDVEARQFYASHLMHGTTGIPLAYQLKYGRQCDWFRALDKVLRDKKTTKEVLQISIGQLWERMSLLINTDEWFEMVDGKKVTHELPTNIKKLGEKYLVWRRKGYAGLVEEWRFGNNHARVVTDKIEDLILSLFCKQGYSTYMSEVCVAYRKFITGEETVFHAETGEVFNPEEFYIAAKGKEKKKAQAKGVDVPMVPYVLGESTVDYYLKKGDNPAKIAKLRMKGQDYGTLFRPSVSRHAPVYAFSKLTMDDIDLPFKGPDGDRVVKSYQFYDCASGALVGVAFSEDKNVNLIREGLRDMLRRIIRYGWGMPYEIEMERHLTTQMMGKWDEANEMWMNDVFTPGAVFPFIRVCQSAQAKRAEGFIKKKKYGHQRKRKGFQGRFYAKLLTNRLNTDQKQLRQLYEEIVCNELMDIDAYNNELHANQELYPNMTRWQVLVSCQNPSLPVFRAEQVMPYIGYSAATSIRAGVARVFYGDYQLPDIELIQRQHYNGEITGYYLPNDNDEIESVFLYEDGKFLCEAKKKLSFNEAAAEQTDDDRRIMEQQWGQQKRFDAMIKEGVARMEPVAITERTPIPEGGSNYMALAMAKQEPAGKALPKPKKVAGGSAGLTMTGDDIVLPEEPFNFGNRADRMF